MTISKPKTIAKAEVLGVVEIAENKTEKKKIEIDIKDEAQLKNLPSYKFVVEVNDENNPEDVKNSKILSVKKLPTEYIKKANKNEDWLAISTNLVYSYLSDYSLDVDQIQKAYMVEGFYQTRKNPKFADGDLVKVDSQTLYKFYISSQKLSEDERKYWKEIFELK